MKERDKAKIKIQKLLNMTTDHGASENEALLAAQKAGELMEFFDIHSSELDIKGTKSIQKSFDAIRYGRGNIGDSAIVVLSRMFDCKVWTSGNGKNTYNLFGFPEDVEVAAYLYKVISNSILSEIKKYKFSNEYKELKNQGVHGKTIASNFRLGIEGRVCQRLQEMANDKKENIVSKTGNALVLLKEQQVEDDFNDLGISLSSRRKYYSKFNEDAYVAGNNKGNDINLNMGVNGKQQKSLT